MKLPISLLVLAALGQAASTESAAKSSGVKSSDTKGSGAKQKQPNLTSKRELSEGNFGERKTELSSKLGASEVSPGIKYAENTKEDLPDQSPAQQSFGARLPQIAKISDVLTGQGPPFEIAVANHLYAPVSIYQARLSSPTSFEVPSPAASQIAYPNSKADQTHKLAEDDQKQQELPTKDAQLPQLNFDNVPVFAVKQPRFRFESYPRPFGLGFSHQQSSLRQDIFRPPQQFSKLVPQLFSLYDELGPNRYPGHILPSQHSQQQGIYTLVPVDPGIDYVNQEEGNNRENRYPKQNNREELKAEPTERPNVQKETPVSKQSYHAHPNGAISFASFSQSLPSRHEPAPQMQPDKSSQIQQLLNELQSQQQHLTLEPHPQNQKVAAIKQNLQYPSMFQQYIPQFQNNFPGFQLEPQYITVQHPTRNQPRNLNPLQQQLLFEDRRHSPLPPTIQFQGLPTFKPLSQSQLTSESLFQPKSTSPIIHESLPHLKPWPQPRPFGYHDISTQNPTHINQPLAPISAHRQFTPLPPLQPNYNQNVKPLNPYTRTSPAFLPTPVQPLTVTPKSQPVPDQLISSTTIHPDIKDNQENEEQSVHSEIQPQSQQSESMATEMSHVFQPTVLPLLIQSTTHQPFATDEAQSEQYSTPQPEYQSTSHSQSTETSPRHEVIIQQQELQEYIPEPSSLPSSNPHYKPQLHDNHNHQQDREINQLQSQQHQHLDQLPPQQYQREIPEIKSQQHQYEAQNLQTPQLQPTVQQIMPLQYTNQQLSEHTQQLQPTVQQIVPLQYTNQQLSEHTQQLQFQPQQLQIQQQQHEPEKLQTRQQLQETHIKQQQYQREPYLEPQHQLEVSSPKTEIPQKKSEPQLEFQLQPEPQHQIQFQLQQNEQPKRLPTPPGPKLSPSDSSETLSSPILSPIQSVFSRIYAQPPAVAKPEFITPLGIPTFPNVQYFGNFAESIFGNHHH